MVGGFGLSWAGAVGCRFEVVGRVAGWAAEEWFLFPLYPFLVWVWVIHVR